MNVRSRRSLTETCLEPLGLRVTRLFYFSPHVRHPLHNTALLHHYNGPNHRGPSHTVRCQADGFVHCRIIRRHCGVKGCWTLKRSCIFNDSLSRPNKHRLRRFPHRNRDLLFCLFVCITLGPIEPAPLSRLRVESIHWPK